MLTAKISNKNQIVIPKEAREGMKVKAGDRLLVNIVNGMTILLPKRKKISEMLKGISKGVYPENYVFGERDSW